MEVFGGIDFIGAGSVAGSLISRDTAPDQGSAAASGGRALPAARADRATA